MLFGEAGAQLGRAGEVGEQRLERSAGDEHDRRVDDVLAGRAAVQHRCSRVVAQALPQHADERRHRGALFRGRAAERAEVERAGVGHGVEVACGFDGRKSGADERPNQRELDVDHRL